MTQIAEGAIIDERFVLGKAIGAGGMGSVFEASQVELDRIVAIKFMAESMASDPESFARFQREAQVLSQLHHKNIVSVYAFGIWQRTPYMVMERVLGRSLQEMLRTNEPLSPDLVLNIALQACDGMQAAHSMGIIHRDLKPINLIVNENSELKIIDFGLAKLLTPSGVNQQQLTEAGAAVGSVLYMSPEQCLGRPVDSRADIYALGCVLHHCLSGAPPFPGDHSVVVMMQHTTNVAPRVSNISESWQNILDNAMAKDPNNRYQNSDELRADLVKLSAGQPVALLHGALEPSTPNVEIVNPARSKSTNRRAVVAAAAIAVAVSCAALFTVSTSLQKGSEPPSFVFRDISQLDALHLQVEDEKDPEKHLALAEKAAFAYTAAAKSGDERSRLFWQQAQNYARDVYQHTDFSKRAAALKKVRPCFGGEEGDALYSSGLRDAAFDGIQYARSQPENAPVARDYLLAVLELASNEPPSGFYWETMSKVTGYLLNVDLSVADRSIVKSDGARVLAIARRIPTDKLDALSALTSIGDMLHQNHFDKESSTVFAEYLGPRIELDDAVVRRSPEACAEFLQNLLISMHQLNHLDTVEHYVPLYFKLYGRTDDLDFLARKLAFSCCFPNQQANDLAWGMVKELQAKKDLKSKQIVALFFIHYAYLVMGSTPEDAYKLVPDLSQLGPVFQLKEFNARCRIQLELNHLADAEGWSKRGLKLIASSNDGLGYGDRFAANIMAADLADAHNDKKATAGYLAEAKRLATSGSKTIDEQSAMIQLKEKYKQHGINPTP